MPRFVDVGLSVLLTDRQMAFLQQQADEHDDSVTAQAARLLFEAEPDLGGQVEATVRAAVDAAIAEGRQDGP